MEQKTKKDNWIGPKNWDKKAEEYAEGTHIIVKEIDETGGKFWIFILPKDEYENTDKKCMCKNKTIITLKQALTEMTDENCKNRAGVKEILDRILEKQPMEPNGKTRKPEGITLVFFYYEK